MATVNIDDSVWTDPRFVLVGKGFGLSAYDVIGRMAKIWAYCTEKGAYSLDAQTIDVIAELDAFAVALVTCGLAENKNGEIRIKGTRGRIEWLRNLRKNARKGGLAASAKRHARRNASGNPDANPGVSPSSITTASAITKKNKYTDGFEEVYQSYPRKEGKSNGFKIYQRDIKSPEDRNLLIAAIQNYVAKKSDRPEYMLHFSTFMGQWRDWLDPDAGTIRLNVKKAEIKSEEELEREIEARRARALGGSHV
jgi:hypothetical protein